MKVIINADDLGMSLEVNDAIFALIARGCLTSATVLANGVALGDAITRARDFPKCSFGIHLNASEFRPLTDDPGLSPIRDRTGNFINNRLREICITPALQDAIVSEWLAQVNLVRSLGLAVSHLDSHHHMHTVPGIFFSLKKVQKVAGINRVRTTMNIYPDRLRPSPALRLKKELWNFALRYWGTTRTTDGLSSLRLFLEAVHERKPLDRLRVVELMVHPGSREAADETRLLVSEWWRELPFPIEPISFNEL
jgi:predicted glycoside hydrolase/deacetylase ChbG (UPF0249 family)